MKELEFLALHFIDLSFSEYEFSDLLGEGNKLNEIESKILARMETAISSGVKPVSAGISRILLREKVTQEVINGMQARRNTLAENERARGSFAPVGRAHDR